MAKTLVIGLAVLGLLSLLAVLLAFGHGLWARFQMHRYKRLAEARPASRQRCCKSQDD